ncbi:MAG TPA: hypothetical protein PKH39_18100 [Woeseiaceae bacterium]|nr:hypothetical protein [Woeseiaceae bacterium]
MIRFPVCTIGIIAAIWALTSVPAQAGKFNAVVNGKSYHLNSDYRWNEDNYGFGLEHEFDQRSAWKKVVMVNGFRDSANNMSYMAGAGLHRRLYQTDRFNGFYIYAGINAFLMTRKNINNNNPFPGALPSISIGNDTAGFNFTYLPRQAVEETMNTNFVDPSLKGILFLQFKISMDQLLP